MEKHCILQYPGILQQNIEYPFLFSPNFDYFIDLDHARKQLIVRKAESMEMVGTIPKSFFSLTAGDYQLNLTENKDSTRNVYNEKAIQTKARNLLFRSEKLI